MKILIADKLSDVAVNALEDMGAEVTVSPDLKAEDLPNELGEAEVLVVRSTKVTAAAIESAPSLSLIIRAGAGVNTIDLACASQHGVYVTNTPGKNTDAVAELAIGLLIASDRRIVNASNDLKAGHWEKKKYGKASGLQGRTLGIIGLGAIGRATAKRAQALGMNVLAWSRSLTPEKAEELDFEYAETVDQIAEKADAVSLHLASTPETKHLINEDFLSKMKPDAILVNTSRGEIIDSQALLKAIDEKGLRVGLDVFEDEPTGGKADFLNKELAEAVSCTPHIGASTNQAAEAVADEVVQIVKNYKESGSPLNVVNLREKAAGTVNLTVRHYNKVGVLAKVFDELQNAGINIEEIANSIFQGEDAAICNMRLDNEPTAEVIAGIKSGENVIKVILE